MYQELQLKNGLKLMKNMENKCTVVHFKKDEFDVYIGRGSKWGNPFTHISDRTTLAKYIVGTRKESILAYKEWITNGDGQYLLDDLSELKGKKLGCWCHPKPCHGDVLKELVNKSSGFKFDGD